jgi:O-acetylserine/cysteine efflux transporter
MKPADVLLALLVVFIWGTNFVAMRAAAMELPPMLLLAVRLGIAAVAMLPFARLPRGQAGAVFLIATTMAVIHFGGAMLALQYIEAGTASLIVQTTVPFSALLAWAAFGDRLGWRRAAGMAVAFAGIVLIVGEPRVGARLDMVAVMLVSAFAFAAANIQIRRLRPIPFMTLNAWIAIFGAGQAAALSAVLESGHAALLSAVSLPAWGAILYMALVVSLVGHGLWYRIVPRYETNLLMPFTLLVPVVSVAVGIAVLDETLTWWIAAGGALTVGGVAVIVVRRPETAAVAAPTPERP